jgi:hypothetical protein
MNERQTLSHLANQIRMMTSRATIREIDDGHLMQQVKHADVYHSETPSDFERWQMVGISAHPLKQDEDDTKQKNSKQSSGGAAGSADQGDWNHDQPKGKSAEAIMVYPGGNRSHPIAIVDDRRVRPYNMPEGSSAFYDASGTGQMTYFNGDGAYLVSVNNARYGKDQEEKERFASLRHVTKKAQEREIKEEQKQEEYKHEGESVNAEVRCTGTRIEFRIGADVVAYIDKDKFVTKIETRLGDENADHPVYGVNGGVGKTTKTSGPGAVLVKAPQPGPPTSEDMAP